MDPESADWVRSLAGTGGARDEAVARLHQLMLRAARAELARRRSRLDVTGPELDDLAHQAADDAVVAVLRKVADFRGDSRFTTWAYKFAILEVSAKLGRHFWQKPDVALDAARWERLPDRFGVGPAQLAESADLLAAVRSIVEQELTAHQRRVFVAIVVDGIPLDALVGTLGPTRGAIYKTLFDSRRKIRAALVAKDYLTSETARRG